MTTTFIDSPRLNEVALQKTRNGSYKMELEYPTRPIVNHKTNGRIKTIIFKFKGGNWAKRIIGQSF